MTVKEFRDFLATLGDDRILSFVHVSTDRQSRCVYDKIDGVAGSKNELKVYLSRPRVESTRNDR